MSRSKQITVTSHVARDFLQNSAYFNTWAKIIWEYVANSLDAAKDISPVIVVVDITSQYVKISDNGRGMSREELRSFFQMHGENMQRRRGKRVRGRFGTGKSAAFGLANNLSIDTCQNGLRNVVGLHRNDIENAKSGEPFPVRDVLINEQADTDDGTSIQITEFNTSTNVDQIITYIERHLSRYRQRARVSINGHECQFAEPPFIHSYTIPAPNDVERLIGPVNLIVKVSAIPLDDETKGIDVLSYGIWHGNTLAGIEKREYSNRLFGEVEVPLLEDGEWPVPAFDNTRNNILNPQNPVVATLLGWISEELEKIRSAVASNELERRRSEQARRLAKEAELIAQLLNQDFEQLELELELTRRVARQSGGRSVDEILDEQGQLWPGEGDNPTPWEETGPLHGNGKRGSAAGEGNEPRSGPTARSGQGIGAAKSLEAGRSKKRRTAFSIDFEHGTADAPRSRYDREAKTILINLDHLQIANAYNAGGKQTDSLQFREMCYEVASVEYALAVPFEKLERDEFYHASDALFDVRETINRVTMRFSRLLTESEN